ncbi:hypothetical protein THAOC_20609 [Thalassiosira oceanica]|uniref:Uncharacterized protein n=1 Tax=Thalassiosira oceanica TaxID=159749 RepID=K0S1Z2_THAOC|nr:hypothetical protein THAOC_20609 [Thalassiosira oceanica]|eukprot:EJK59200.1 hypothetical protein THAOC_20609 [Thalassiosira oceanica]
MDTQRMDTQQLDVATGQFSCDLKASAFFDIFEKRSGAFHCVLRGTSERRFGTASAEEETTTARERSASQFRSVIMPRFLSEGAEGASNDDVSSAGRSSSRVRAPSLRARESRESAPMLADELAISRRRQCRRRRARAVREWRVLTSEQQKERKKAQADAKAAKASTKRKRQQKSDEEKTADLAAKQARWPHGRRRRGNSSVDRPAAASASTNTKGRKASKACSQAKQLVDKTSRQKVECTEKAALRYADATRHADGADMGGAFSQQMVMPVNNVRKKQTRNGGGSNASTRNRTLEEPNVRVVAPSVARSSSPLREGNATFALGKEQLEKLHAAKKRAPKGQTQQQVNQNLGAALSSQTFGSPFTISTIRRTSPNPIQAIIRLDSLRTLKAVTGIVRQVDARPVSRRPVLLTVATKSLNGRIVAGGAGDHCSGDFNFSVHTLGVHLPAFAPKIHGQKVLEVAVVALPLVRALLAGSDPASSVRYEVECPMLQQWNISGAGSPGCLA